MKMKLLSSIEKIQRSIEKGACYAAAGLVFIMIFPTTLDVILRYFKAPLPEIFQLTEFMMVGVVYLAIAYVQTLKDHIKIEIATAWLPRKYQIVLDLFGYLAGIFVFSIITWQSGKLAWEAWETQDYTMGIVHFPTWPAKSILPLGTGLLCLRLITDFLLEIRKLLQNESGKEPPEERNQL
jgi:TRAP-type C4-dicarboxylate transport system permease small subunit